MFEWPPFVAFTRCAARYCLVLSIAVPAGLAVAPPETVGAQLPSRPPSISDLEAAARRDSNDAGSHYALAMGYWEKKKWDEAEKALQVAVLLAPGFADAHLALAVLPERRGDRYWRARIKESGEASVRSVFQQSEGHFRRAFLLNPLVDLKVMGKVDLAENVQIVRIGNQYLFVVPLWWTATLEKSINELRTGRYEKGFGRMEELVHRKEFGGDDRNLPERILWYHGLFAAHLEKFEVASRDFAILTGRAFAAEKDTTAAQVFWSPLRTNDYRFILATMLYLGGKHQQAVLTYRRALEFDIGLYVAHVQMARMYESDGQFEDALRERRLALEVNPEDPDLQVDLAGTLIAAGELAEALDPLAEAARLNPRDARVPYLQGMVAQQLSRSELARESLGRFLTIAPSRFATQIEDAKVRLASLH
jgi:tetratricopeptide (TPR) repeat protein